MLTTLAALFPTIAGWINLILGYFQAKKQAEDAANSAEIKAESEHQNDGAQSVIDQESSDAQNAALDKIKDQLSDPIPVVVITQPITEVKK